MLNRTNRTLSANPNRLNLGTRSFALTLGTNMGQQSLRNRHAHPDLGMDAPRPDIARAIGSPFIGGYPMPAISGSSLVSPWLSISLGVRPWAEVVVGAPSVTFPVVEDVRVCEADSALSESLSKLEPSARKRCAGARLSTRLRRGEGTARTTRTTEPVAVALSGDASGG